MHTAGREQIVAVVVRTLTPYVGATMAAASTAGIIQKQGLNLDRLDRNQARTLVDALGPGLSVFVGRDKARMLVDKLWQDLELLLGAT